MKKLQFAREHSISGHLSAKLRCRFYAVSNCGGVMIKRARGGEFGNGGVREERLVSRDIKFRRDSRRTVYTVNGKNSGIYLVLFKNENCAFFFVASFKKF